MTDRIVKTTLLLQGMNKSFLQPYRYAGMLMLWVLTRMSGNQRRKPIKHPPFFFFFINPGLLGNWSVTTVTDRTLHAQSYQRRQEVAHTHHTLWEVKKTVKVEEDANISQKQQTKRLC